MSEGWLSRLPEMLEQLERHNTVRLEDMLIIDMSRDQFEEFKQLQVRRRWDYPAAFGCNCHGEIWSWKNYGYTKPEDREPVRGLSRVIDAVADRYLQVREEGGRFFINERGAFYRHADARRVQFVSSRISA